MCVLSIKVPIRRKSGKLSYTPRMYTFMKTSFVNVYDMTLVFMCVNES